MGLGQTPPPDKPPPPPDKTPLWPNPPLAKIKPRAKNPL